MVNFKLLTLRFWVIVLGIITGISIYILTIKPILIQNSIINTNKDIRIKYQKYQNSILVHMIPSGWTFWFDGSQLYVYGDPTGRVCDTGFEPVYVYDVSNKHLSEYECARMLKDVEKYYDDKKVPVQYMFLKPNKDTDVYSVINAFIDNGIISIPAPKT